MCWQAWSHSWGQSQRRRRWRRAMGEVGEVSRPACLVCGRAKDGVERKMGGYGSRIGVCGLFGSQFSCLQTCSACQLQEPQWLPHPAERRHGPLHHWRSRTSTHWRNSGSLSPTEAWTPAQNSSMQMARARKSGRGRILPAPVVVMISSFNPRQSKMAQGYGGEEQRRGCMKRTDCMRAG